MLECVDIPATLGQHVDGSDKAPSASASKSGTFSAGSPNNCVVLRLAVQRPAGGACWGGRGRGGGAAGLKLGAW